MLLRITISFEVSSYTCLFGFHKELSKDMKKCYFQVTSCQEFTKADFLLHDLLWMIFYKITIIQCTCSCFRILGKSLLGSPRSGLPRSMPNADQCRLKFWHGSQMSINSNWSPLIGNDRHWEAFQINAMILIGIDWHWLALIGIGHWSALGIDRGSLARCLSVRYIRYFIAFWLLRSYSHKSHFEKKMANN